MKFTRKSKIKRGLSEITLAEYLGEEKKKKAAKSLTISNPHLTKDGQNRFVMECVKRGLPAPTPEYKPFEDIKRKHSVDFVFFHGDHKLALEVEGWGHRTDARYKSDLFKYNELAIRGYRIIRVKPKELYLETTFKLLRRFFQNHSI